MWKTWEKGIATDTFISGQDLVNYFNYHLKSKIRLEKRYLSCIFQKKDEWNLVSPATQSRKRKKRKMLVNGSVVIWTSSSSTTVINFFIFIFVRQNLWNVKNRIQIVHKTVINNAKTQTMCYFCPWTIPSILHPVWQTLRFMLVQSSQLKIISNTVLVQPLLTPAVTSPLFCWVKQ